MTRAASQQSSEASRFETVKIGYSFGQEDRKFQKFFEFLFDLTMTIDEIEEKMLEFGRRFAGQKKCTFYGASIVSVG